MGSTIYKTVVDVGDIHRVVDKNTSAYDRDNK